MTAPAVINSAELSDLLHTSAPPRVIDVRTPGEFETAHIAGAYNVPLDLLREHREDIIGHLDSDVVLVCRSGQRAAQAQDTLRTAGLANVHILNGGITAFDPDGTTEHFPFPDLITTNICFGGEDMRDAWVTCSSTGKLFKCRWPRPGLKLNFNA